MRIASQLSLVITLACVALADAQGATVLDASYVASTSSAPVSESAFSIGTAGRYRLTLTDLQTPAALDAVRAVVTRGAQVVARADATGSVEFDATAGDYRLRALAAAPAHGTLGASVAALSGGTPVLEAVYPVAPEAATDSAQSLLQQRFAIAMAGDYELQFVDVAVPAALASWDLLLLAPDLSVAARLCSPAQPPACSGSTTAPFTAVAGEYELLVDATAGGAQQAGLYRVGVRGAQTAYADTVPVGRMRAAAVFAVPAAATLQLSVADRQFPQALAELHVALAQGDAAPALLSGPGAASFPAVAGEARLFVLPVAAAQTGAGSFSVRVGQGAQTLYALTRLEPETEHFIVALPTAGAHTLTVRDFDFPAPLQHSYVLAGQDDTLLDTLSGNGSAAFDAVAGTARISFSAAASGGGGVAGFRLESATGETLLDASRGVGTLVGSTSLLIGADGSYDLRLADLQFPEALATLAIAVTRGTEAIAQVYGGGQVTFAATSGEYQLSVVASAGSGVRHGLYGVEVSSTPAPTLTLQASSTSVTPQQSVTLTWNATGASACTAGGGWSGALATSGSAQAGPFAADATLSVTCNGPGGSATQSIQVAVAKDSDGGGGATGPWSLLVLAALCGRRLRQWRARGGAGRSRLH
jgi:hypothetical protein